MKKKRIVVIKIGSSVIAPEGKLDSALVNRIVKDILRAEKLGFKVVVVSSGAIACGLNLLGYKKRPSDMHSLMAISSLGQIQLMDVFNARFRKYKRICAQILLTWDDFDDRTRFMNIRKTVDNLLAMNVVPIINENDVVSHEEISLGDNDYLSALVANLVEAEQLIMLSDVEGLCDNGRVVKEVSQIDDKVRSLVLRQKKTHTKGGMDTKLDAATQANLSGIHTRIASGRCKDVIWRILSGQNIGTFFIASQKIGKARKRWIHSNRIKGTITIDDGAKQALLHKGKSLLSVGIIDVSTGFKKADAVAVVDKCGCVIGCGLVNYDSYQLINAKQTKLDKEVIHRDNFVKAVQDWVYHPYRRFSNKKKI